MAASVMATKPILHVEVVLSAASTLAATAQALRINISRWVEDSFVTVEMGQTLHGYHDYEHSRLIERIEVAEYTGPPDPTGFHQIEDVVIDVQAYCLHTTAIASKRDGDEASAAFTNLRPILNLPNVAYKDDWTSLVFDTNLHSHLLNYLVRTIDITRRSTSNLHDCNRLCLLYGPPGSGKSTLCHALAQKLSIRLQATFPRGILIEIDTSTLLSKYFGESGKLITAAFDDICQHAQDTQLLVCVMIDEVESIAGKRTIAASGSDCNDGLRATNQLLTALDRLRRLPNIIVLCTSNMLTALDPAFLDRADRKEFIPSPSPQAIYNIFRSSLNALISTGAILSPAPTPSSDLSYDYTPVVTTATSTSSSSSPQIPSTTPSPATTDTPALLADTDNRAHPIPTYSTMQILHADQPLSPCRRLWATAQAAAGMSGRALRRLPWQALARFTYPLNGVVGIEEALDALGRAVGEERVSKGEEGSGTAVEGFVVVRGVEGAMTASGRKRKRCGCECHA